VRADFLEAALREALVEPGLRITGVHPAGGGCIHSAARLSTTSGDLFAKWNEEAAPDLFASEAATLRALRAAGTGLVVPEVLASAPPRADRPGYIVMEYLTPSAQGADHEALGRGLAALHRHPAEAFGFPVTTYCGSTPQENAFLESWAEFYAERRLRALLRRLDASGRLRPNDRQLLDRVIARLPALLAPETVPSLIHGDLWSGNVLATLRGPALVDPACAYADREMEFGIATLFGGFGDRFFAAYEEVWPLPAGWRERNPLYQLYHLLNHFLIFGGGYGGEALGLARRFA